MTAREGEQRPIRSVDLSGVLTTGVELSAGYLYDVLRLTGDAAGKLARSRQQPWSQPAALAAKEHSDGRP